VFDVYCVGVDSIWKFNIFYVLCKESNRVRFEVFTAVTGMLRRVALVRTDVSEEPSASFITVKFLRSVRRLLVAASVVPSSPILVTQMKEALGSSETSVFTRAKWLNIPEDTILQRNREFCL
jgi:hypothetical protein